MIKRSLLAFSLLGLGFAGPACGGDSTSTGSGSDTESGSGTDSGTASSSVGNTDSATDSVGTASASGSGTDSATSVGSDSATSDSTTAGSSGSASGTASAGSSGTASGTASAGSSGTASAGSSGTASGTAAGSGSGTAGGTPCTQNSDCDDLLPCNGVETCVNNFCEAGTAVVCDDGFSCTVDTCEEAGGTCVFLKQDTLCSDGLFCTGIETCDPQNGAANTGCVAGVAPDCDDGVTCTNDACDEVTNKCTHTPDSGSCSNGQFCDGAEVCDPVNGCVDGPDPDCADAFPCTTDACNEGTDQCDHTPNDGVCDNGVFCDGVEVCDVNNGCSDGPDVVCPNDDGVACTVESCDETNNTCKSEKDNSKCNVGEFCSDSGCVAGQDCTQDSDCNDNLACNGVETCNLNTNPGKCEPGTPVVCNDNKSCTFDYCSDPNGTCVYEPQDGACSDGSLCTGTETCNPNAGNADATTGCVPGTPLNCVDNVPCTLDGQCLPQFGCIYTPQDDLCDDNTICNGSEYCDPDDVTADGNGCVAGQDVVCPPDGIACTSDACTEFGSGCNYEGDDSVCACGESCDPNQGCGNFCNVATCQGKVYECGDCQDNDSDCDVDFEDSNCFGPCDDNEQGLKGEISGQQNNDSCTKMDCYFDQDSGAGNDDCFWAHSCDPTDPNPSTEPGAANNMICTYDPNTGFPMGKDCSDYDDMQSQQCLDFCGALVPNGCDCFGCCVISKDPGSACTVDGDCTGTGGTCNTQTGLCEYTVYLGSEDKNGNGTCDIDSVDDPSKCHACQQVAGGCLNTCELCEVCLGKPDLPPECTPDQQCDETPPCGQPGQDPCPAGAFCLTGCGVFF